MLNKAMSKLNILLYLFSQTFSLRQTHKLLIWKFILFCTTCFSHQALVTCCLQLMGFEPSPQEVKVVLVSNQKSYKKVTVRPQSNNRTPQKLVFLKTRPLRGLLILCPPPPAPKICDMSAIYRDFT